MDELKANKCYRDLLVWQKSMNLTVECYKLTSLFPRSEMYGLASQIQRAAVSVPSNIAEGNERESEREFLHHLRIAAGSLAELETQIELAFRFGYTSKKCVIPCSFNAKRLEECFLDCVRD